MGVHGLPRRPVLYASAEAHFSIEKSANILGLGTDALRRVPVDGDSRVDVAALRGMIATDRAAGLAPFCVVGIAGVTSNGVIDPLNALADVAAESGLWYHVDAAYGAGGLMSEALKPAYHGIARADSVTLDPHKWWHMPFPCGAILTRDGEAGRRAFVHEAVYIPETEDAIEFRDHGLAGSRPFSALKLWLAMKLRGAPRLRPPRRDPGGAHAALRRRADEGRRLGTRDAGGHGDHGGAVRRTGGRADGRTGRRRRADG